MLGELAKGNSRLQLVNIDTGFVQVDVTIYPLLLLVPFNSCLQVDQSISHHDMWDYLELTQKGYSKAFEPVNELLTQVSAFIVKVKGMPSIKRCNNKGIFFKEGGGSSTI